MNNIMYSAMEYVYDMEDGCTDFRGIAFVTADKAKALCYFEEKDNVYLGCDRWLKIKVVDVIVK